jgi:hypothetical protein
MVTSTKKLCLSIILVLCCEYGFSQIKNINLVIGKNVLYVTKYFDSLNSLKTNPTYKIKKDVSAYGDLTLTIEFSISDQQFYNCIGVTAGFQRSPSGVEICTNEFVWGSTEYADANMAYVKDNFKFVSNNIWEKPLYGDTRNLKIKAKFDRIEGNYPSFMISYFLKEEK